MKCATRRDATTRHVLEFKGVDTIEIEALLHGGGHPLELTLCKFNRVVGLLLQQHEAVLAQAVVPARVGQNIKFNNIINKINKINRESGKAYAQSRADS